MSYYNDHYDDRTCKELESIETIDYKVKVNAEPVYGVYLDYFYLCIVRTEDEVRHKQIEYDLKYEKDCKRLNKMHSIHKFEISELSNMNGIICYSNTSETLESLGEFPDIEWI